ncbi:MAG: CTP synthase [Candidatus Eisenbacteria sp.]|nr:CTP synthase [Candidatus Eisenbacteria bacterium]
MTTKYIFVTGGVVSSLGKGIAAASLGQLLKNRGLGITILKLDPYLNVDPGTMSPFQHGEVFVTDDGAETDLDLGHYERFVGIDLGQDNNATAGQIYDAVITRERRGGYLGGTVQVIPHVTDEIKSRIYRLGDRDEIDVCIAEIGGTVGDIESLPFLEAIRQVRLDHGVGSTLYIHVTLVPFIKAAGEIKTKPTQHSVRALREIGIQPDILLCRTECPLGRSIREKIALFCNVAVGNVIEAGDVRCIYEVPLRFREEGLDQRVVDHLGIDAPETDIAEWEAMVQRIHAGDRLVRIGICGKYVNLQDAYKSINEALTHAGIGNGCRVEAQWIDSEFLNSDNISAHLADLDAILVPGGFGDRGIDGKLHAVRYARENDVPYLGICLGMQCAVIEFARNVLGLQDANSREFDAESPHRVIDLMSSQEGILDMGGTMRLGSFECVLQPGTRSAEAYAATPVQERHRHRYEFNSAYEQQFETAGMVVSGASPDGRLAEIVEIPLHPWFVGCQFHPEFKSRPMKAHPLFLAFVKAALAYSASRETAAPGTETSRLR